MLLYHRVLIQISSGYPPDKRQIVYALRTRAPVSARRLLPRLACVRPAASVHPEPGSNSSSLNSFISLTDLFFCSGRMLYAPTNWLQVSLDSLNLFCAVQHYVNVRVVSYFGQIALLCEWANCLFLCEWANCLFCVNGRIAFFVWMGELPFAPTNALSSHLRVQRYGVFLN